MIQKLHTYIWREYVILLDRKMKKFEKIYFFNYELALTTTRYLLKVRAGS